MFDASGQALKEGGDRFQLITDIETFQSLRGDWGDLCRRCKRARFSQSFEWCWTSWQTVEGKRGRRLHCIVVRNTERIVLIWPFTIYRQSGWWVGAPLGCAYSEYPDPLVEDGVEALKRIETAWQCLCETSNCDIIILRYVRRGSLLQQVLRRKSAKPISRVTRLCVSWEDHTDWESYYRSRQVKDRRDTERRQRRLEEISAVSFEAVHGTAAVPLIDWAIIEKIKQLHQKKTKGVWLTTQSYRDLLASAAITPAPYGSLMVFVLKSNGAVIAGLIGRVDATRIETLNTVYESAYRKYAPGKILLVGCLKWAFDRGLAFDFRGGDFAYKREWANRDTAMFNYRIINSAAYALYVRFPWLEPCSHFCRPQAKHFRTLLGWLRTW